MTLFIHAWLPKAYNVLGPGGRALIWVQGCSLHCPGCMVPETWNRGKGYRYDPFSLGEEILQRTDIEGITVSGGEPTEQPEAVSRLLSVIKNAGKNTWVYTGYTLEELVARNDPATDKLLSLTDVLIDGKYIEKKAGIYNYKGSANQRLIGLTTNILPNLYEDPASSRLEIMLTEKGEMVILGIPPPNFFQKFNNVLKRRGLNIT